MAITTQQNTGGGNAGAGTGGPVNVPTPIHLPPVTTPTGPVPPGPATTEQARSFASVGTINRATTAAETITQQTSLISAANKYIPLSYGHNRWSGYCYFFKTHPTTGALVIGLLLSEGVIEGVLAVEHGNLPLRAGCTYTAYTGAAGQPVDPTVASVLAAQVPSVIYADALPGLAHVVLTLAAGAYSVSEITGFDVEYLGKKVFDPRDLAQDITNPTTWLYNANAGLVTGDFVSSGYALARAVNPRYGRRCNVAAPGLSAVANLCDELIGNAPNQRPRSQLHCTLLDPTANETWEQTFRTHALCFVDRLGDAVELIPDVPRSPVLTLNSQQIIQYEKVSERLVGAAPTMMDITYTDTSVKPWRARSFKLYDTRVLTGEIPEIPSTVNLQFCQSYAQAQALGKRRLNTTALSVRGWGFTTGAEGYVLQKSNLVSVTHPLGMVNKIWAVDTTTDRSYGEVSLKVSEYDVGAYSDVITTTPATLGSGAANCASVPNITGLALAQQSINELQPGSGYACIIRIKATCNAANFPCLASYEWQLLSAGTVLGTWNTGTNAWLSDPLSAGTYDVKVRCTSGQPGQAPGAWATATITITSAICPPVNTTRLTSVGTHTRTWSNVMGGGYAFFNQLQRVITCVASPSSVTRTELWFGYGPSSTFGTASKVRDDAGNQTAWCFYKHWVNNGGAFAEFATVALGSSPSIPSGGPFNSPGSATAGGYADALTGYTGAPGEWWSPHKVWVRHNNAGVFSVPVELVLSLPEVTFVGVPGYTPHADMYDGSALVRQGDVLSYTQSTGMSGAYPGFNQVNGVLNYLNTSGSNHRVGGQVFDGWGDIVSGHAQWQLWRSD